MRKYGGRAKIKGFVYFLAGWLLFSPPLWADIYMYVDSEGVIHFTNAPTSSKYRLYIREKSAAAEKFFTTDKFDNFISEASQIHGVAFSLIKSVIKAESDFNPRAVSRKGALGLMQIMPFNLAGLNIEDPFDPRENILGGSCYLKKMLSRFNGDLQLALAAYNAGPEAVIRYSGIPPYTETENYVRKVMGYYAVYKTKSRGH